ncbi:MAG: carboxypeptidase-like regulatory domain-containing protein [Rubrivivax sp.]
MRTLTCALVALATLLSGACSERNATPVEALAAPASARVDAALCAGDAAPAVGPLRHRAVDGQCLRASLALDAADAPRGLRLRALASTPSRPATADELFDWAEVAYAQYFPSHRVTLTLGPYTYRYYPESQNHLAVADGLVYIQGPISGGPLATVGSVLDYSCRAVPALCADTAADCAPLAQWSAGGNTCQADAGQDARIAHGARFSFTDHGGPLFGVAPMQCNNGTLVALDAASCSTTPLAACNTSGLSWSAGDQSCTPNATEPAQIGSGTRYTFRDSVQNWGQASYQCTNGTLTATDVPSCNPRPASGNCTPIDITWFAGGQGCTASAVPPEVSDGTEYTFVASTGTTVGRATFRCSAGTLLQQGSPTCDPAPILDSFGGPGGSADGGASGDGTAADGAPIVGGTVRVTDTSGKVATATTDTRGYWRVRLTGMVPPLVVRVTRPDGVVRHSVSTQALRTNGYIFIAVTGLTDKIASDLAAQADLVGSASLTPTRLASLGSSAVGNAVTALRNHPVVRPALVAAGLNPDGFDPLSTPFRADQTGYDRVLDNLVVVVDDNGQTVVRDRVCTISQVSWTVGNLTCSAGSAGTLIRLNPGSTVTMNDGSGSTQGAATFACEQGLVVQKAASCRSVP